jgi:hypothetical protein
VRRHIGDAAQVAFYDLTSVRHTLGVDVGEHVGLDGSRLARGRQHLVVGLRGWLLLNHDRRVRARRLGRSQNRHAHQF